MSPHDRQFWLRAQRRAAGLQPDIAAAILRAFGIIRDSLSDAQLARIIESGNLDRLLTEALSDAVMERAFVPYRERIREGVSTSVKFFAADLPKAGKVNGTLAVSFDYLNPRVIDAVRQLDTKAVQTLVGDVRETVRAFTENGLRDGVNPRVIGRQIRNVVGLAPSQEVIVRNFEQALRGNEGRDPTTYTLRDKRFDRAIAKGELTEAQIERMTAAYRKRFIAFNAETNARTTSLDAMKLGQRLSWQDAAKKGIVDLNRMTKTWKGVMDDRERPEHVAMQDQTVPFDSPFSNGEMIPGDSTFNCRCTPVYRQATA